MIFIGRVENKLREERIKRNMTIDEFANLIGLNKISYYQYENGTRTVPADVVKDISKKLNKKEEDIFCHKVFNKRIKPRSRLDYEVLYMIFLKTLLTYKFIYYFNQIFKISTFYVIL